MLRLHETPISIFIAIASGLILLRIFLSFKSIIYSLRQYWWKLDELAQTHQEFDIPKYNQWGQENPLYRRAAAYLATLSSLEEAPFATLFSSDRKSNDFFTLLHLGNTANDSFLNRPLSWSHPTENRLVLRLRRHDRSHVLRPYLQHIESVADDLELRRRETRLYTNTTSAVNTAGARWTSNPFTHPATLDTVAMDGDLKTRLRNDLESFSKARNYYQRLGRVYRRSYLLYGPPGTGKSTFAAAMAKFLCFDVYEVDVSSLNAANDVGAQLKSLMLSTTPRSLILIENFDKLAGGGAAESPSRLAGILDFMDGVASCCSEERVLVFTMTTSPDGFSGVDPALLRPGRLDVHVHFPLCDFSSFKMLANSYLGISDHKLFPVVEELFQSGGKISPADVCEIMIFNKGSASRALRMVMNALHLSYVNLNVNGVRRLSNGGDMKFVDVAASRRSFDVVSGDVGALRFGKELRKLYGMIKMRSRREQDDRNDNGGLQ